MQTINMAAMKRQIHNLAVRKRRPLYFHGASGIGKSQGIEQAAREADGVLVDFRVSQYESIDLRGIPDIQHGTTVWNMPATLPFKGNPKFDNDFTNPNKPIFLFMDEVNQGDPSVLSVLYQLVQDRRVGEHELLDNVCMLMAGNRAQDRGISTKFPDPLNNRATHFELASDVKSWSKWASAKWGSRDPGYMTVVGFLNFRSELLHTHDPHKPAVVFATPRSWEAAADDFVDMEMNAEDRMSAIAGSVTEAAALELDAFSRIMMNLPPIEKIIADPMRVPVPTELDVQWAMATHVAGHMNKDTAAPLHKFLARIEPEMVVLSWTLAIGRDADVTDSDAFIYDYAPAYRGLFQN